MVADLVEETRRLAEAVDALSFTAPVAAVYNPLNYAWEPHHQYLQRFGAGSGRIVLVGMNPGPFGMAQSGVPFGDVAMVRDWMGIEGHVGHPDSEHPKRPVEGFSFGRAEVSGTRLWGWARSRFRTPHAFFQRFFVINHCPLLFLHATGRNLTPDKLVAAERSRLLEVCDRSLRGMLATLRPSRVIGVGVWAQKRAASCVDDAVPVGRVLHPSPASPAANRGWEAQAEQQLMEQGVDLPS